MLPIGAWPERGDSQLAAGTGFRVWAPDHAAVELAYAGEFRPLERDERGYWSASFADIAAGARYLYRLNHDDGQTFPDPASRFQPEGVHGPSQVVDPAVFRWTDQEWRPPARDGLVFYELHVGTFSPAGTFRGVMERLPYLAQLGISAIELMPVGDFPGSHNWGYDGVSIFAPARSYGTPDDLRRLVNAAHQHGLAVFLDVVYNHFGPDGAYANVFSAHYFTDRHRSPWGRGVNLDGPHSREVRDFFIANALHWIREYHVDGLRLDATHALQDDSQLHFLAEFGATVRARAGRPVILVAEDHRNLTTLTLPVADGGWGLDAVWADDFHHQVRVHVAGDCEGYYCDFSGTAADLASTIEGGWFFRGQQSVHLGEPRGTDPAPLEPRQFVVCIQNHDQIGNRADGGRLTDEIDAASYRAISTLLLMVPQTPLLFMGQEWGASSPFLYFTDHNEELGRLVSAGRREEFASFSAFADPARREAIPDPQEAATFERSRLLWDELDQPAHASLLRLYQRLTGLRATAPALRATTRSAYAVRALDGETVALSRGAGDERLIVVVRLSGGGTVSLDDAAGAQTLLTTEDADLATDPMPVDIARRGHSLALTFARPGAAILRAKA